MSKEKKLSDEDRAQIDHVAQVEGERDPKNTRLSDGRTVAGAQADAERINNEWEAERQQRKATQARERETAQKAKEAPQTTTQQTGGKKAAGDK